MNENKDIPVWGVWVIEGLDENQNAQWIGRAGKWVRSFEKAARFTTEHKAERQAEAVGGKAFQVLV